VAQALLDHENEVLLVGHVRAFGCPLN
jgi:hypothetical protein